MSLIRTTIVSGQGVAGDARPLLTRLRGLRPASSMPESAHPCPHPSPASKPTARSIPATVVIIGAGPAGLTAAYQLVKRDAVPVVLEADSVVGGISRTAQADGWRFDIGGHRFFTKVTPVEAAVARDPGRRRVPGAARA